MSWMVAGCVGSLLVVSALIDSDAQRAAMWAGMIAPLAAAMATWIAVERTYRRAPERVMTVMLHGFAAKIVFFLGYVTLALRVLALEPAPFVISFTSYFVALYLAVGVWLQRISVRSLRQAR